MDQITCELRETRTFTNYSDTSLKVFSEVDMRECKNFINVLAEENYLKLREFYEALYMSKATRYELELAYLRQQYEQRYQLFIKEVNDNEALLERSLKKDVKHTEVIEHISNFPRKYNKKKSIFAAWKEWVRDKIKLRKDEDKYHNFQRNKLLKKAFSFWNGITYKSAMELKFKRTLERDINLMKEEYSTVIMDIEREIEERKRTLEIKRLARKEFVYSLNKQLLKAISNLSIESMNLNQIDLIERNVTGIPTASVMLQKLYQMIDQLKRYMIVEETTINVRR